MGCCTWLTPWFPYFQQRASAIEAELRAAKERVDLAQVRPLHMTAGSRSSFMLSTVETLVCQSAVQQRLLERPAVETATLTPSSTK